MPAIASLEDLKAAQKEGVSNYAMLYACLPVGTALPVILRPALRDYGGQVAPCLRQAGIGHSVNTQTFFLGRFQIFKRCNRWHGCLNITHSAEGMAPPIVKRKALVVTLNFSSSFL